jgi:RNA polymerase sigma-70 factor (ECF subfamily)
MFASTLFTISPQKNMWWKKHNQLSDEQIVQQILQTGNTDLFRVLYERYAQKVYGKCLDMVKNKNDAEDLLHDILAKKVFLKLSSFEGNSSFRTWVYRIAHNHCIDFLRDKHKLITHSYDNARRVPSVDDEPSSELLEVEDNDDIERKKLFEIRVDRLEVLMEQLDPEDRSILLMKYRDDMSIDELRIILGMSGISATKMRVKRARDRLRNLYKNIYGTDD